MPDHEQILAGLHLVSNRAQAVAWVWHILAVLALVGIAAGWRPARQTVSLLLVPPVLSVAVAAWIHHNPFNGTVFAVLASALGALGLRMSSVPARRSQHWVLALGIAMVGFGLVYPHFLDGGSLLRYLYAAPMGLVPCPTLSFVIGVALVTDGLGSRAWALVLATVGLFYGVFGVVRLGVFLDVGLILGAAGLLLRTLLRGEQPTQPFSSP
jgi:hypothetical protein